MAGPNRMTSGSLFKLTFVAATGGNPIRLRGLGLRPWLLLCRSPARFALGVAELRLRRPPSASGNDETRHRNEAAAG